MFALKRVINPIARSVPSNIRQFAEVSHPKINYPLYPDFRERANGLLISYKDYFQVPKMQKSYESLKAIVKDESKNFITEDEVNVIKTIGKIAFDERASQYCDGTEDKNWISFIHALDDVQREVSGLKSDFELYSGI